MEDKYGTTLLLLGFFNAIAKKLSREGMRRYLLTCFQVIQLILANIKEEIFFVNE